MEERREYVEFRCQKYNKSVAILKNKLGEDGLESLFELLKNRHFKEQI